MTAISQDLTIDQAFHQAVQLQNAGQLQQAEQLYNKVLAAQPHFHAAWFQLGVMASGVGKMQMAAELIAKASELRPVEFAYHRALCEIYRRLQHLDKAMHHGLQATMHAPNDADSFYNYGLALADAKKFDAAIEAYSKAIAINPRYGLAYNNLGSAYENMDDEGAAYDAYKKAVDINPKHSEAQHNIGAILNQRGKIDEAKACYIAAIESNPQFVYAHHSLSTLKKYAADDPHVQMLEDMIPSVAHMNHEMQTKFWFALGKVRGDVGRYKESFEAYNNANTLHRQTFPYNIEDTKSRISDIISRYDAPLAQKAVQGFPDDAPVFILGMPRSGSTLIEQILDSHSQIHGAGELSYLSDVIADTAGLEIGMSYMDWLKDADDAVLHDMGQRYVEKLRQHGEGELRIVDKMPGNFFYTGLIHKMLPNAKIIHSMRDPMDICISNFTRMFKQSMAFAYDLGELGQYCRACHEMMAHWQTVIPSQNFLELHYEALVGDVEQQAKELIAFCGLEWEASCLDFYNNKRIVKTASHAQVIQPIYNSSVKRWKKYEAHIEPLMAALAK